jgi:hypothetical protein
MSISQAETRIKRALFLDFTTHAQCSSDGGGGGAHLLYYSGIRGRHSPTMGLRPRTALLISSELSSARIIKIFGHTLASRDLSTRPHHNQLEMRETEEPFNQGNSLEELRARFELQIPSPRRTILNLGTGKIAALL